MSQSRVMSLVEAAPYQRGGRLRGIAVLVSDRPAFRYAGSRGHRPPVHGHRAGVHCGVACAKLHAPSIF